VTASTSPRPRGATFAAIALALAALSPSLAAQGQLAREISFVRSLAREMRFIELAKAESDRLAAEYRGAGDQDKIAQLAVEVAYYGARSRNDRSQQRALFKETIDKSKELVDRSSDGSVQIEALTTLANASQDFGQFLIEELDIAREEAPEKVKELEAEAAQVLRGGIEACTKVKAALSSLRSDPQKEVEYYLMWMKLAVLTREQARADKENRSILIGRAIEELTEMVLEVGEETAIGLRGLFEIAQSQEVGGDVSEAITFYKDTIDQIATSLNQAQTGELEISGEMQQFLFDMMQEVYVRAGQVMAREGAPGTAELFTSFREHVGKFGEKGADVFDVVHPEHGHLMLLAESRFLAESGDSKKVSQALTMTQRINDKHPSDYVGVKAKSVLRDILEAQKSLVSGALLFEVAKGELQNKNYEEAIKGMRRAIAAMTPEESQQLGLEAYRMLGSAFGLSDRFLESILALTQGLRSFGKPEHAVSSDVADSLDRAMSIHKRMTKNDPFFEPLWTETAQVIAQFSAAGASKLSWKLAQELFNEQKYLESAREFEKVTPDFLYYEQARVRISRAYAAAGKFAEARKALVDYRAFVEKTELNARDTSRQQVRTFALTDAAFNEVQMAYYEARGNDEFKMSRNVEAYGPAIERAQAFLTNFKKDGEVYVPVVLAYVGRLYADIADLDRAQQAYVQLKASDPVRASRLATEIFKEYEDRVKALSDELDQAIAKEKGDSAIAAAERDLGAMRQKLVGLGMDYVQSSPMPQLGILVKTMQNWEQLGEWTKVDEVARKTLDLYGNEQEAGTKRVIDQLVRPMIGEALLQQHRFQEAYDMLIGAEKANPNHWEIKRQIARALGGWFEFSRTGMGVRVPGLERYAEAYEKHFTEYRQWAERPDVAKYSLEWYRFQWECYWFAKQAGQKDTKYRDIAEKFYRIARATDDFATLKSFGAEGNKLFKYFQSNR
jgi:hypothetical protein